ncbi:Fimbrin [Pleurostoma richardsiae]|uniref:Fimbrin n=1 Tax=Pleurostoma richardsiae TaxID=41990 RepID=A0AA38RRA0_9PEZI|nr:Fimbrin [Pleurostoma richardsiae]
MNVLKIQRKFPQFQQNEIFNLADSFRKLDVDDKGYIDEPTAIKATQQTERQPYDVVRQALKEVGLDSSRRVELEDYVGLVAKLRESSPAQKRMSTGPTPLSPSGVVAQRTGGHASKGSVSGKIQVQGSNANITHTINEDERTEFTRHINAVLAGDPDIGARLPFPTDTFEMFDECKDGLVLAKLINDSVPDTIDERVLNVPGRKTKNLNAFQMTENNNIVIESAKGIGCSVVNIGSGDIIEVREHLILGLIWQIIRRGLLGKIDIKLHPELYRLLEEDETLEQFLRLPPEQILLRWFNYHLKAANWPRRVTNFSSDVKDGENYTVLLAHIGAEYGCNRAPLQTRDLLQRAEEVLQNADKLGCRKFLTPTSLVAGNPKLNLAFVANLFNTHPCLDPITEEEKLEVEDFDAEGEREARVFTLWLNSLDVQPAVVSFFDDLRDGTILLQAYDKVIKGSVNWRHVNKRPANGGEIMRFKAVENTNYAIELGKQYGFSLVGIQGADITDGQRTLTLGLVWQLMRKDITVTLSTLAQRLGKREMNDSEMVRWANDMSRKGGRNSSIRSFKDPAIGTGVFLLDVLNGMKSSYVDYDLVTPGRTDEEAYMNAKLSISIARKMGATIWLVPEDICQVRSRLVTTFIGSLMATHEKMQH